VSGSRPIQPDQFRCLLHPAQALRAAETPPAVNAPASLRDVVGIIKYQHPVLDKVCPDLTMQRFAELLLEERGGVHA